MAKKNSTYEKKNGKSKSKSLLTDERIKIALGIFISGFAVLLFISFISYLFTWKTDQSFEWSRVFSEPEYRVDNWSGKVGAYFANIFMNRWFGIASFVIPFIMQLFGFTLMKVKIKRLWFIITASTFGMILFSIWMGYLFGSFNGILGSGPGGKHGLYVSQWLIAFSGTFGTALILIATTLTWMVFSHPKTLDWLAGLFKIKVPMPAFKGKDQSLQNITGRLFELSKETFFPSSPSSL